MDRKKIERRIMAEIHIIVFLPVSLIILMRIISSFTMKAVIVVVIVYISFLQLKKLRFLCRKLETYLNKDVRHYFNEIEYEVNQISDYKLINDFQTSELFELKIKSINTKRNKKFFEKFVLDDFIENIYIMRALFYILQSNDEKIFLRKEYPCFTKNNIEKCNSIDILMEKYEEIMCRGFIEKYSFLYYGKLNLLTKKVLIKENEIVILFIREERNHIENGIAQLVTMCDPMSRR